MIFKQCILFQLFKANRSKQQTKKWLQEEDFASACSPWTQEWKWQSYVSVDISRRIYFAVFANYDLNLIGLHRFRVSIPRLVQAEDLKQSRRRIFMRSSAVQFFPVVELEIETSKLGFLLASPFQSLTAVLPLSATSHQSCQRTFARFSDFFISHLLLPCLQLASLRTRFSLSSISQPRMHQCNVFIDS